MGLNSFLKSLFGDKSTRDMKLIQPIVDKIKAGYPEIKALDNDALRARTKEIQQYVQQSATEQKKQCILWLFLLSETIQMQAKSSANPYTEPINI